MNRSGESCAILVRMTNLPEGISKRDFEDFVRQAILIHSQSQEDPRLRLYSRTTIKQFNL